MYILDIVDYFILFNFIKISCSLLDPIFVVWRRKQKLIYSLNVVMLQNFGVG